ncbi:MAG: PAS domain-containing hybrid sensor histidine kinase/response regulator [Ilumatobacteraceae bacterium]
MPFDQLPVAAAVVGLDGRFQSVNALFCELFGCAESTPLSQHARVIADPLDASWPAVHLDQVHTGVIDRRAAHHRFHRFDGQRVVANLRTSPRFGADGQVIGMIAYFSQSAAETPNRYQLLWQALEEQQELMVEWALDGTIQFCNRACRDFFGWPETIIGRHLDDVYDWGDSDSRVLVVGGVMAGLRTEPQQREYQDGRIVEWVDTAVSDDLGNVVSVFSMGRDITEKVRAEDQLAASERRFRAMITNIQDTVLLVDDGGNVMSTASLQLPGLGWGGIEHVPTPLLSAYIHPDDAELGTKWFGELRQLAQGSTSWQEFRVRRADGTYAWIEVAGVNLLDDPAVGALVLTIRNIDDRKRMEEALAERSRRAEEELRQRLALVAQVGHELRNPLQGIQAFSEVLSREPLMGRAVEAAGGISRQARTLRQVVDDLLDASQLGLGMLRVEQQAVDIAPLIDEAVVDARPLAAAAVTVTADPVPEGLRIVAGDAVRVRQALANLLSNACKHTPRGSITVAAQPGEAPNSVRIAVADTGTGIRPDDVDRLFRPFERGADARRQSIPGIGLGLAIVTGIAAALGGTASAAPRPDGGAIFWIELPLATADHPEPPQPDDPAAPIPPRRVLVVDDEPLNLLASRFLLTDMGATVVTASSAEEALDQLAGDDFDVVFTDIHLPNMDGYELARRIRSSMRSPLVVVMSGDTSDTAHLEAIEAGADLFLPKPTNMSDLAMALRRNRR